MRYLLDSHIAIWAQHPGPSQRRLTKAIRAILSDPENQLYVSIASLWEIAIKVALGKLEVDKHFFGSMEDYGYEILPIDGEHIAGILKLPPHHNDPFDRMLIAQAQHEKLTLITCDVGFKAYGVKIILA